MRFSRLVFLCRGRDVFRRISNLFSSGVRQSGSPALHPAHRVSGFKSTGSVLVFVAGGSRESVFLVHGSAIAAPQGGEGKGAAGLSLCIRN